MRTLPGLGAGRQSRPATGRLPRWSLPPLSAALVLVLLLGAVGAGLRIPGLTYLAGLPGFGSLDYRSLPGAGFLPLRADYVDDLLGTQLGGRGPVGGSFRNPSAADSSGSGLERLLAPSVRVQAPTAAGAGPRVVDHPFTNDDMDRALLISSLPFTGRTDTRTAGREDADPSGCARSGGTSWYRYTPPRDVLLSADTIGSDHATALGVFNQSPRGTMRQVGCATGVTGGARLTFSATRGTTYLFQVTDLVSGGRLVFHLAALGRTTSASADVEGRTVEEFETAAVSGNGRFVAFNSRPLDNCMVQRCPDEVNSPQVYVTDRVSGRTELVSRNSLGLPGNAGSIGASLSHDGRYVGFTSAASDLVDSDTNRAPDYFVHDRLTGRTVLATLSSEGEQGTAEGTPYLSLYTVAGHLSADGRYAAFHSVLDGLAPGDQRGTYDVFVRDLRTGVTTIETLDGNADHRGDAREPRISANGRYVSFVSPWRFDEARYPRCDDLESCRNVFLRDRLRETTRLVSVDRTGLADSAVGQHQMSADGSVLAWATTSTLGDPSDTNGVSDVFVVRGSGHPTRVSLSHAGEQQDDRGVGSEFSPADLRHVALSGDGRRVAFDSRAPNLVPGDTNERMDVFVRDLESQTTTRVSTSSTGGEANGDSFRPTVSFDGRVVAFESDAADLAPGDDNRLADVFVHDLSGV